MVGDAAVRDRGKVTRYGPWLLVVIACKTRFTLIDHPDDFISGWLMLIIRMCCGDYPDVYALPASFALPWIGEAETSFWFGFVVRNGSKKDCFICPVSEAGEKAINKLDVKEFRERFCIPNGVSIDLVNEEAAMPTEKGEENVILFTKEQFNSWLRFPLPALFKEFLHFSQIPPIFIHPNLVRVLMGCSIINMLYNLDLTLLEVFFVYSLKKAKNDIFSVSAHLPSLQVVTELPDSIKGGAKGLVAVRGGWAGAIGGCVEALFSKLYLKNSRSGIEGPPCGLGGKGVLRLCLQIIRDKSQGDGLQDIAFRAEFDGGRPGVPGICSRQKRGPDSPPKKTPAKRRKLVKKNGKDVKEPTPPKEFPPPQITYEREVMIEEPVNAAPHSISSGPGRISGLNHSGTSLAAVARLANVAEEVASINRPGNLNPDANAAETTPLEEAGVESQSQPSDDPDRLAIIPVKGPPSKKPRSTRNLRFGLFGRLQERQQEIEVSCASAHDAHPDGGEVEMATETSAAPAIIPAEDASRQMRPDEDVGVPNPGTEFTFCSSSEEEPADDAAPASPLSYAELEAKLKQVTPGWTAIKPMLRSGEGLCGMAQQHDLYTHLLQTADYMKTFSSRRQEIENQLRLRMEEAEASLSTMREENEALRVELAEAKSREESTAGRLHEAEGEAARLRDELRLDVQKEELEREFAVEREELAADYQQQVDDTLSLGIAAA
ncbi:hypothetical protein CK203_018302 [Vitis vinifera]|uniref:Uncharacterized protein n=1 Tax=Vitis vinifera TaxID=29760 RepID=A0A438JPE2_VITVI|nr:hypothetical protein CK203_018302 [Vitis vinifera]